MDRRKSIQTIILGASASAMAFHGCKTEGKEVAETLPEISKTSHFGRTPEELERIEKLDAEQLFNVHELETISVLSTVILPPNEPFGGPLEADVPAFIEFMGKDLPELQQVLLGGLMWLDHASNTAFGKEFKTAALAEQQELCDQICWHDPETPLEEQPLEIQFFAVMRRLESLI